MPLGISQRSHSDGKLCELRNEHQNLGLALIAHHRCEREQPSRGP